MTDHPRAQGRPPALGIRAHLVILALLALLPAWGLAGFAAWRFADVERARLLGIGGDAARDIADVVAREVAGIRAGLAALATSPALAAGDLAGFDRQLGLLYGGGALSVTLEPAEPEEQAPYLQRNADTGRPELLFRQALPADRDDAASLVLRSDAVRFWSAILERARLPQGWVASILDPRSTILARFPDGERFVGRSVHPDAQRMLQEAGTTLPSGWGSGSTREGDPVRIAWRRVNGLPWIVLVGIPAQAVEGALDRAVLPVLLAGVPVLLALSLASAVWASRRIAAPLRALEATAVRATGRASPPEPSPSGVREIDAAARALATAAQRLGDREAEIASLAARLEAVLESTTDGVVVLDQRMVATYMNSRARFLLRDGSGATQPFGPLFLSAFETATRNGQRTSVTAEAAGGDRRWFAADVFPSAQGVTVFFRDVTDSRVAEAALRASEARLQAVLDQMPVGVLLAEAPSGMIVLTNRRIAEILGVPAVRAEALDPYGGFPAFDAEDRPLPPSRSAVARALAGEQGVQDEFRLRRGDGRLVWVRVLAAPIRDPGGQVSGAVAAVADIDAERCAEAALREGEERFRVLAEAVPQIVWSCTPDGVLEYLNPRFFEFTGLPPDLPPASAELPIHPEDRGPTGHAWRQALADGTPYQAEYRLRAGGGGWRWFVARALPAKDASGTIRRWIGTATDVTELVETRKALERQVAAEAAAREAAVGAAAALAESEARFRGFAEASPDVLWMLNPGTDRLGYLSPAYAEIWGEAPPPPEEARFADLLRGLDAQDAAVGATLLPRLANGDAVQAELRIRRSDAQVIWVRFEGFPIGTPGPDGPRVGGVIRDVTRRKDADRRQRLLIDELNHRVKNTLATVLALARQTERRARRAAQGEGEGAKDAEVEQAAADAGFVVEFQARLMALARGHDLLTASTWRGAMLQEVAAASLSPWRGETGANPRIRFAGPAVWLAPRQALGLSLAIHEMATNAAKHGALRGSEGQIRFLWQRARDGSVEAEWVESQGPTVVPPESSSFGTRLLRHGLATELGQGSEITLDYPPEGFRATIRFHPAREEAVA